MKLTPNGVSYGTDSTEKVFDTFSGGKIAPGSSINFLKNHWSSYCILGELLWPGNIKLMSLVPVGKIGTPSNPFSLESFTSAAQLLLRTICSVLSRFRNDKPPLKPSPQPDKSCMGAPIKSYCKYSFISKGAFEQMMLSNWKSKTCFAGASCSHSQGVVIKAETSVCFSKPTALDRSRSWIDPSLIFRWNDFDTGLKVGVVKRRMGQSGPRTEEKWRITGTSLESARLSTITATFDPTEGFRKEGSML